MSSDLLWAFQPKRMIVHRRAEIESAADAELRTAPHP